MLTTYRKLNGQTWLFWNGVQVGYTWRIPGKRYYGLKLYGIYWYRGSYNRIQGSGATVCPRAKDAQNLARAVLATESEYIIKFVTSEKGDNL
jgi:hypothetical protein